MLEHGGRLLRAVRDYGIAREEWLDLSTGINLQGFPPPPIPAQAWQRLPEDDDGLLDAARAYYGAAHVLAVAGTQAAIQALPALRASSRVGVISPGYAEHAQAWRRTGHAVETLDADSLFAQADRFDVIVLIHPNNPGCERFETQALLALHARLAARGGWLIVDEAFIDATPECSVSAYSDREGLIVLRSVGKFFGLAGARVGFVCAAATLLENVREHLGPWTLSGPARYVVEAALRDEVWHGLARADLQARSMHLQQLLSKHGLAPTAACAFFQWHRDDDAPALHRALARQGILTRVFDEPVSLRFGVPAGDAAFARLDRALALIRAESAR
jgi:L-threonine-O-3-phosphate decarboxylase